MATKRTTLTTNGDWPRSTRGERVTVLVPTYNRAHWLLETISSVLEQTYREIVVIVSDNWSTDDTAAVVASFADERLHLVRPPAHVGLVQHFDWCLEQVETEYVLVVPDDDALDPEHLERCVPVADANPGVALVHTTFDVVDEQGAVLRRSMALVPDAFEAGETFIERSMSSLWRVHATTALMRTRAIRDAALFRDEDLPGPDFALWMRVALAWDFAFVRKAGVRFRVHGASYSADLGGLSAGQYLNDIRHPSEMLAVKLRFIEENVDRLRDPERLRAIAWRSRRADLLDNISDRTFPDRPLRETLSLLGYAVRLDPRHALEPRAWRLALLAVMPGVVTGALRKARKTNRFRSVEAVSQ